MEQLVPAVIKRGRLGLAYTPAQKRGQWLMQHQQPAHIVSAETAYCFATIAH